ncbi:MAG: hypothetical protein IE918_06715 [Campylobacterales bacterium]|nr:hypothetical protein [Campylobacterales bacterium]
MQKPIVADHRPAITLLKRKSAIVYTCGGAKEESFCERSRQKFSRENVPEER